MTFDEVLAQIRELLAAKGRVTYRALKVRFNLTDEHLEACTEELIEAERVAVDENGKVLVWTGGKGNGESAKRKLSVHNSQLLVPNPQLANVAN